jgi:streptogrisin C
MRFNRRAALAVSVVVAALISAVAWNAAGADPVTPVTVNGVPNLDASQVAGSIAYLENTYGVSQSEALRRLKLQAEAGQIDQQLQQNLGDSYGGVWLDQVNGGVLRVAATDTGDVSSALKKLPDAAHIKVSRVTRTLRQLTALQSTLNGQVSLADGAVAIDVTTNQVVVYQRSGGAAIGRASHTMKSYVQAQGAPKNPDSRLKALAASHPGVVLRQMVVGVNRSALATDPPSSCSPQNCPPPLRGGMRLDIKRTTANTDSDNLDPMWGQCTTGFILYNASTRQYYALTAGHCLVGSDKTGVTHAYNDAGTEIGYEVPDYVNSAASYPTDYGLLTVPNYTYWFGGAPRNDVDIYCTAVESTGCTSASMPITGYASYSGSHVGDVVCATGSGNNEPNHGGYKSSGATPGTRCGEVTGANGGFVTNICSRKGDSGGPLFSEVTGQAYGVLNDGTAGSGNCPSGNTEWSQYSPVDKILSALNAQVASKEGRLGRFVLRANP